MIQGARKEREREMGLRDIESKLPPGFRFYPSDEELVCHYLLKKVSNERVTGGTMVEVDLHTREPWELPEVAKLSAKEWYFFSFRDRKYATGLRTNRATKSGYWKATGKDRSVHDPISREIVGMRKTLVFYGGRAPNGIKTNWVMHEFRLESPNAPPKEDWVLCRVFNKNKGEATSCSLDDEQENSIKHNDSNNSYYQFGSSSSSYLESSHPPNDLDGHQHQLLMPADHGCYELPMVSAAAFPTVPQQEGNGILNLAVLHYNFLNDQVDNTDELMLDVAFNGQDLVGGGMTSLGGVRFHGVKDQFF